MRTRRASTTGTASAPRRSRLTASLNGGRPVSMQTRKRARTALLAAAAGIAAVAVPTLSPTTVEAHEGGGCHAFPTGNGTYWNGGGAHCPSWIPMQYFVEVTCRRPDGTTFKVYGPVKLSPNTSYAGCNGLQAVGWKILY